MVTRLPRDVYVLQAGLVLNAFGNGAANPFLLIYLHDVRGIPLAVAGIASGVSATFALVAALATGSLADRLGPRLTTMAGLLVSTAGFALYPLVREGWHAIALALLTGTGVGSWITGQSALLAAITPVDRRAFAFAQQRVAANVGLGLGGFAGGLLVTTEDAGSFTTLFLLNAVTFVAYAFFLARVRSPRPARAERPGTYADVMRDRTLVAVAAVNFAFVAGSISLFIGLMPVFVTGEAGVDESTVGTLFLLNSVAIIVAQLPVARLQQGRSRAVALAQMGALFVATWLLVLGAGTSLEGRAVATLVVAVLVFSLAECLYDAVHGPLVADLAPPGLTGRYLAANGFAWQLGFITGPSAGAAILGASPTALWPIAATLCLAGGTLGLVVGRRLPDDVRTTPRSG